MSHLFTQGPGRPTRNSQRAGIANTLLSFGRRRTPPPPPLIWDQEAQVPTVVHTPATPAHSLDSPIQAKVTRTPNPFRTMLREEVPDEFSTTIKAPTFTPTHENLKLPIVSTHESATESSVTEEEGYYICYQNQLTDMLRAMTDRLAALSYQPAAQTTPSEPKPRVKP